MLERLAERRGLGGGGSLHSSGHAHDRQWELACRRVAERLEQHISGVEPRLGSILMESIPEVSARKPDAALALNRSRVGGGIARGHRGHRVRRAPRGHDVLGRGRLGWVECDEDVAHVRMLQLELLQLVQVVGDRDATCLVGAQEVPRGPTRLALGHEGGVLVQVQLRRLVRERVEPLRLRRARCAPHDDLCIWRMACKDDLIEGFVKAGIRRLDGELPAARKLAHAGHLRARHDLVLEGRRHLGDVPVRRAAAHCVPLRTVEDLEHVVVGHELEDEVGGRLRHACRGHRPDRRARRHEVPLDEVRRVALLAQKVAEADGILVGGRRGEEGLGIGLEGGHLAQHAQEGGRRHVRLRREQPAQAL